MERVIIHQFYVFYLQSKSREELSLFKLWGIKKLKNDHIVRKDQGGEHKEEEEIEEGLPESGEEDEVM